MKFSETTRNPAPARFGAIGTVVEGTVLSIETAPVPEFKNGRVIGPKMDVHGPVTQIDVTLDVDGTPTVLHTRGGIGNAIAKALNGKDLNIGDYLAVRYVADELISDEIDPAKVYEAKVAAAKK